jgi:hypothetical protein
MQGGIPMERSVLDGKTVLIASRNQAIHLAMETLILDQAPSSRVEKVGTCEETIEQVRDWTYDLVVVDLSHARDFDPVKLSTLLNLAECRRFHVIMLTPPGMDPAAPGDFFNDLGRVHFARPVPDEAIETLKRVLREERLSGLMRLALKVQKQVGGFMRTSTAGSRRNAFELATENSDVDPCRRQRRRRSVTGGAKGLVRTVR